MIFNGIASNSSGNWCIWGGKVNFGYDGGVKYLGSTYLVLDGEAFCIDEQIGKGSVGFLELIDPTISGLFNCGYAYDQYTVIGAADDATSLENMRQALYGILKCNELRKAHGLQELKISNSLMAIAEYDTMHLHMRWIISESLRLERTLHGDRPSGIRLTDGIHRKKRTSIRALCECRTLSEYY